MATISQIEVNGTIYDITDHHAASSYLPLSGGTVTGPLILQDKFTQSGQTIKKATNLQKDRVNPLTSNTWGNSEIAFVDANDNRIGFINARERTNGDMEIAIGTSGGGGRVSTLLTKDGKAEYEIPSPDNFTRAIKAKGLSHGIAITQTGDDLNNYFDIGTYYCATTAVATTLLNKPQELTGAFVMYVGYGTGTGYPYQEIIQYNTGDRFFRNNNTTSNPEKWFPWKTFIGGKFLPLSGGTLTGQLNGTKATFNDNVEGKNLVFGKGEAGKQYYLNANTPSRTGRVLFAGGGTLSDGDGNGTVVGLGAGGLTIVGGGEYAQNRYGVKDLNDGDEFLYLGADNAVYIESDAGTISNRKTWKFQPSGQMVAPSTIDGTKNPSALIDAGHFVHSYVSADHNVRDFARQTTTNNIVNMTEVGRYINGAWRWNSLAVGMLPDGTRTYSVSDPAAFRDAIEADLTYLKLNGGTLTGEVTLSGKRLFHRHTNLDRDGASPASNTWGNSEITLRDKDDDRIGLINVQQTTANDIKMWITPRNENASGAEVGTGITLSVSKAGVNSASIGGNTTVTGSTLTLGDGTTAQINAKTPSRTAAVLLVGGGKKTEGDSAGTSVRLGAGGLTLIGGGEYANNRYNVGDLTDLDESLYLGADSAVRIESNGNTIADRKTWIFETSGNLKLPGGGYIYTDVPSIEVGNTAGTNINIVTARDKNSMYFGQIRTGTDANKDPYIGLIARRGSTATNNLVQKGFCIICGANGEAKYNVPDPANFRSAISAFSTAGGTLTGNVTLESSSGGQIFSKSTTADTKLANNGITSGAYYPSFWVADKNNRILSRFEGVVHSNGNIGASIYARNNFNSDGSSYTQNTLTLGVTKAGARYVTISDPAPWRSALELSSFFFVNHSNFITKATTDAASSGYTPVALPASQVSLSVRANSWNVYILHGNIVQMQINLTLTDLWGDTPIAAGSSITWDLKEIGPGIRFNKTGSSPKFLYIFGDLIKPVSNAAIIGSPGTAVHGEITTDSVLNVYCPKQIKKGAVIYLRATLINNQQIWPSTNLFSLAK